jgi:hypothetical protein
VILLDMRGQGKTSMHSFTPCNIFVRFRLSYTYSSFYRLMLGCCTSLIPLTEMSIKELGMSLSVFIGGKLLKTNQVVRKVW